MRIVVFVPADVHCPELTGLMDVFAKANTRVDTPIYEVTIVAEGDRTIRCASGLRVMPDCAFDKYPGHPDTILVAGSVGVRHGVSRQVVDWLIALADAIPRDEMA